MSFEGEVNEPVTGVNPQRGIELSNPASNVPAGLPQKVCQARQVSEVGMNLLSSSCHYSLQPIHSLGSESYTTIQICIIEILL